MLGVRCYARAFSRCGVLPSCCGDFSFQFPGSEHRLSSCVTGAWLPCGLRNLPGSGTDPTSPALAGGFLTTGPPGKPCICILICSLNRPDSLNVGARRTPVAFFHTPHILYQRTTSQVQQSHNFIVSEPTFQLSLTTHRTHSSI